MNFQILYLFSWLEYYLAYIFIVFFFFLSKKFAAQQRKNNIFSNFIKFKKPKHNVFYFKLFKFIDSHSLGNLKQFENPLSCKFSYRVRI